jgi:hypothetical protein
MLRSAQEKCSLLKMERAFLRLTAHERFCGNIIGFMPEPTEKEFHLAIYHLSLSIISRGKGKSAVAAAAYRAGEKITNEYNGVTHDYFRKRGIVHTEILLPESAPPEYADRSTLWNAVEKIEKAKNSRLAREFDIALPAEFNTEQQKNLIRAYCKNTFVSVGMCADIAIHDTGKGNPHAHVMVTVRPFNENKTWGEKQKKVYILDENGERIYDSKKKQYKCNTVKLTDWDNKEKINEWRTNWAMYCNEYLLKNGFNNLIDHRSNKEQGKDEIPTIHLGVAAHQMEQKGIRTKRGNINREIKINNREIRSLKKQLYEINKWLKKQSENAEPTLSETIDKTFQKLHFRNSEHQMHEAMKAAKLINFIKAHDLDDYNKLYHQVNDMKDRLYSVRTSLKTKESRMKELKEVIEQAENYKKYKPIYEAYNSIQPGFADKLLKRDPKADFYNTNYADIALFRAAEKHLKKQLKQGALPTKVWKAELAELTTERDKLYDEYYKLKDDVKQLDNVKREVDEFVRLDTLDRADRLEQQQQRKHDKGLAL